MWKNLITDDTFETVEDAREDLWDSCEEIIYDAMVDHFDTRELLDILLELRTADTAEKEKIYAELDNAWLEVAENVFSDCCIECEDESSV